MYFILKIAQSFLYACTSSGKSIYTKKLKHCIKAVQFIPCLHTFVFESLIMSQFFHPQHCHSFSVADTTETLHQGNLTDIAGKLLMNPR